MSVSAPTNLNRPVTGARYAQTNVGDTLQIIAARELGDAARWIDLVAYNSLIPPFITDSAAAAGPGVLLTGALILVPASALSTSTTQPSTDIFGTDVALDVNGNLIVSNGDFSLVSGLPNLNQALSNRLATEQGELIFHTDYGSLVRSLIGSVEGLEAQLLAAQYAKQAVLADPRVQSVTQASATVVGDAIDTTIELVPIVGSAITIVA